MNMNKIIIKKGKIININLNYNEKLCKLLREISFAVGKESDEGFIDKGILEEFHCKQTSIQNNIKELYNKINNIKFIKYDYIWWYME